MALNHTASMFGSGREPVYPIEIANSAQFNGTGDYLSRTPTVEGDRRKWTYSVWVKEVPYYGGKHTLLTASVSATQLGSIHLTGTAGIYWEDYDGSAVWRLWAQYTPDPTGWTHLVFVYDTTQAVESERQRVYKNGTRITSFVGFESYSPQNYEGFVNRTITHRIGRDTSGGDYHDGYLAEPIFVSGQALGPENFGEWSDQVTGLWVPKDPGSLTYGTNGFHLDFANAGNLGADVSGNNNDWTVNGSPVQTVDTPTNNFCTLNALDPNAGALSNGNLTLASGTAKPTLQPETGEWYYEKDGVGVSYDADASGKFEPDLTPGTYNFGATSFSDTGPTGGEKVISAANLPKPTVMNSAAGAQIVLREGQGGNLDLASNGATVSGTAHHGSYPITNLIDGVKTDASIYVSQSENPTVDITLPVSKAVDYYAITSRFHPDAATQSPRDWTLQGYNGTAWVIIDTVNGATGWGQGQVRTYKVDTPGDYSQYRIDVDANNGFSGRAAFCEIEFFVSTNIQLDPAMVGGPDWVVNKNRDGADGWYVFDTERGDNIRLRFDRDIPEYDLGTGLGVEFEPTLPGYSVGANNNINRLNDSFIDLALKADAITELDKNNNIVSRTVNGTQFGFEIIKYKGNGVSGRLLPIVGACGFAPGMMIFKNLVRAYAWPVYHAAIGAGAVLYLNTTGAQDPSSVWFNNTTPTSTHVTLGSSAAVNQDDDDHIAYLFTDSDIFKAFSYMGNGSADGPFVNLGGRPLWTMYKNASYTSLSSEWGVTDAARDPFNPVGKHLYANRPAAEFDDNAGQLFTSQGFKLNAGYTSLNRSGDLYVGLALLESTKYGNAF